MAPCGGERPSVQLELDALADRRARRSVARWPCARMIELALDRRRRDHDDARGRHGRPRRRAGSGRARRADALPHHQPSEREQRPRAHASRTTGESASDRDQPASAEQHERDRVEPPDVREREPDGRAQRRAGERVRAGQITAITSPRRLSIRAGPIPGIASRSSTERERAVLGAVVDDLLRRHRPDSRERVELLGGRRVQVDRARSATGRRPRRAAAAAPGALDGTSTCSPSASGAARLTSAEVGAPRQRRRRARSRRRSARLAAGGRARAGAPRRRRRRRRAMPPRPAPRAVARRRGRRRRSAPGRRRDRRCRTDAAPSPPRKRAAAKHGRQRERAASGDRLRAE